ncbi:MAG: DUF1501 domain-containing protein, partial [Verrucomicrobiota bacterium]
FSVGLAGGGGEAGITHGETDVYGYHVVRVGVHVHDLHASRLLLCGVDHEQLTYKFQGRRYRLTDVPGHLVTGILA